MIAAPTVKNFLAHVEEMEWSTIEVSASEFPHFEGAICLIPMGLYTLFRETLKTPAKCLEEVLRSGASAKNYLQEPDRQRAWSYLIAARFHAIHALGYGLKVPSVPLLAVMSTLIAMAKMIINPLKLAKINAARAMTRLYLLKNNYSPRSFLYLDRRPETIVSEYTYAMEGLKQFERSVIGATTHATLTTLRFSEIDLNWLVHTKTLKFSEQQPRYGRRYLELSQGQNHSLPTLRTEWVAFQQQLIAAPQAAVATLAFTPSV